MPQERERGTWREERGKKRERVESSKILRPQESILFFP